MVDATLPDVSRYALRRAGSPADAEDAVAEVYAIAWRTWDHIPAEPDTLPWLYGVARKVLANSRRSVNRRDRLRAKLSGQRAVVPPVAPHPEAVVEQAPILQAIARLPAADAELLRLLAWEQLSHAEAALAMGTSENAVALRASRARRRLAEILETMNEREP
jgi:RNA polymerase sigma-70 factor (ECF subfamily)